MPDSLDEVLAGDGEESAALAQLRKELRQARRQIYQQQGSTELIVQAVLDTFQDTPPVVRAPKPPPKARRGANLWALVHCSDWQVGALASDYDTDKARAAVDKMVAKVRKVCEANYGLERFLGCHMVNGGDTVDGSAKRPSHAWDVDSDVMTQGIETAPAMIASVYLALCEMFPRVHASAVRGNHGDEMGKASRNPKRVNWDTVAAKVARLLLRDVLDAKRTFDVEIEKFYQILQVGKTPVLSIHGDQFRGSGGFAGIPYYGIASKAAKWSEAIPEPWDVLIFGHFHVPSAGMWGKKTWYLNGSTMPTNAWALETLAVTSRPAQRLLIFDDERGVIGDHVLWLDE